MVQSSSPIEEFYAKLTFRIKKGTKPFSSGAGRLTHAAEGWGQGDYRALGPGEVTLSLIQQMYWGACLVPG